DAELPQSRDHLPETTGAIGLQRLEGRVKWAIVGTKEVAEQVQLATLKLSGDLDAGDDLQRRRRLGGSLGRLNPGGGVVVRDGDGGEAAAARQIDDLGRTIDSVTLGRVDMEVGTSRGSG